MARWLLLFAVLWTAACGTEPAAPHRAAAADAAKERVLRAIRGTTVSIEIDAEELGDVTARLTELTGRPIVFSDGAAPFMDSIIPSLDLHDVSLATVLTMIQSASEELLVWDVSGESVVFYLESELPERMEFQIFALAHLHYGVGSRFILADDDADGLLEPQDVTDEDNPLFGDEEDWEPDVSAADAEDLLRRIRAEVGPPGTWDPPARLELQGSQTLIAKHERAMLEKLHAFIQDWLDARDDR